MKKAKEEATELPSVEKDEGFPEHEIHSATEDLMRAEKHKKNKKLMKHVHKALAQKKMEIDAISGMTPSAKKKPMESIDDLKAARNEAFTKAGK